MSWPIVPCHQDDCEEGEHSFPPVGERVRVVETVETREPGRVEEIIIQAGVEGIVMSYIAVWHDVDVAIFVRDGQRVWISFDNLEPARAKQLLR